MSSIAITQDVYGHLVEGHKRHASDAMAAALSSVCLARTTADRDKCPGTTPALTAFVLVRSLLSVARL